jgi:hypothetical protein
MKRIVPAFLVLGLLLSGGCVFNSGDEKYSVSGWVKTRDGAPLNRIYVCLGELAVTTDSNGFYKFVDVRINNYYMAADPYEYNSFKYRFEPAGHVVAIKADTTINFTAYPK